ncbi:MAG: hypothetical protein GY714_31920 [Desulfobacterales bacterium]|nr:hypothetical protein [Desulfobacterales bacterium]
MKKKIFKISFISMFVFFTVSAYAETFNGVVVGEDPGGLGYEAAYESVGLLNKGHNLRLQSPNGIYFHVDTDGVRKTPLGISPNGLNFDSHTLFLYGGTTLNDGFRIRTDETFFGEYNDAIIFEKTDGNHENPDGGIAFTNKGSDGIVETSMVIKGNGYVGIGNILPHSRLHVTRGTDSALDKGGFLILGDTDNKNVSIDNNEIMARNNGALSTLYLQNDGGAIGIHANNPVNTRVYITNEGNLNIGKKPSDKYKLNVAGTVRADEIIVNTEGADYVFEEDYKLKPLSEVELFIKKNKHLPEIPSASKMQKNGVSVSEMQTKLLSKVEELTLYLINQNKMMLKMKKDNNLLRAELNNLKKQLGK